MILVNTLDVIDNRVTPHQLLQSGKSPFLGHFAKNPLCQSLGIFSSSQIISNRTGRASIACLMSAFINSTGSSSQPGAL